MHTTKDTNMPNIAAILGIIFVTLKLVGVIHWSWWLVVLPFLGIVGWALVLFVASVLVMARMR